MIEMLAITVAKITIESASNSMRSSIALRGRRRCCSSVAIMLPLRLPVALAARRAKPEKEDMT